MDINKAIRKQEKSNKRFLFFLGFIFFVLPVVEFIAGKGNAFFLSYLIIIEFLIMTAIFINSNKSYLYFISDGYKLKVRLKLMEEELNVLCEKVVWIHTEGCLESMNIILLTNSKFRSKKLRVVDEDFLRQHPLTAQHYYKTKMNYPESSFFYLIITSGGYKKYKLLDILYRTCIHAHYSDDAIERIKEYRKN